jgi:hypothetical protein
MGAVMAGFMLDACVAVAPSATRPSPCPVPVPRITPRQLKAREAEALLRDRFEEQ